VTFSEAAISLGTHRVLDNTFHNTQQTLTRMAERGYHRIAFLKQIDASSRVNARQHGAFLQYAASHARDELRVFDIPMDVTPGLALWNDVRDFCPKALLVGYSGLILRLPDDLAQIPWASLAVWEHHLETSPELLRVASGNLLRLEERATAAVDMLDFQIRRQDRGLPARRQTLLIDGSWIEGKRCPIERSRHVSHHRAAPLPEYGSSPRAITKSYGSPKNKVLAVSELWPDPAPMNNPSITTPRVIKRPADARGRADHGWLQARFTFSFAGYFDPDHMGFHALRVMNNDTIQPGGGFPTHPHSNMEIFTYVIDGELEHRDSMGNGAVLAPGNLQYMSAGAGIQHSEFNPSRQNPTHLYQIWLHPRETGGKPRYMEKPLADFAKANDLTLLYSGDGREGSTEIRQDAEISYGQADAERTVTVPASEKMPHAWVQVIAGEIAVLGETLSTADGIAIEDAPDAFEIVAKQNSQFLVFRLS